MESDDKIVIDIDNGRIAIEGLAVGTGDSHFIADGPNANISTVEPLVDEVGIQDIEDLRGEDPIVAEVQEGTDATTGVPGSEYVPVLTNDVNDGALVAEVGDALPYDLVDPDGTYVIDESSLIRDFGLVEPFAEDVVEANVAFEGPEVDDFVETIKAEVRSATGPNAPVSRLGHKDLDQVIKDETMRNPGRDLF